MSNVDLEKIREIKDEVLSNWLDKVDLKDFQSFENLTEDIEINSKLSVGYIFDPNEKQYVLQIRAGTDTGPTYQKAIKAKELAEANGTTANIVIVEGARVPTLKEVEVEKPHPFLQGPKEQLHIGLSIGHPDGRPGTLGAFVESVDGTGFLSCSHVLARSGKADPGDWIHHPGKPDTPELSARTRVALLSKDFIEFSRQGRNSMDAAIAVMRENIQHSKNFIPYGLSCPVEGQTLKAIVNPTTLNLGTRIGKIGRTTGYTEGTLTATDLEIVRIRNSVLNYAIPFTNVIEITWDTDTAFSAPGDSGAILFTLDPVRAVGIHFAGNRRKDTKKTGLSYACHLDSILQHFNASLVS